MAKKIETPEETAIPEETPPASAKVGMNVWLADAVHTREYGSGGEAGFKVWCKQYGVPKFNPRPEWDRLWSEYLRTEPKS